MSPMQTEPRENFGAFWPLAFLAASLATVLLWNLVMGIRDYETAQRLQDRQMLAGAQAAATEQKMTVLMRDLIGMAAADADARTIVEKYQIRYNAPVTAPAAEPRISGGTVEGTSGRDAAEKRQQ